MIQFFFQILLFLGATLVFTKTAPKNQPKLQNIKKNLIQLLVKAVPIFMIIYFKVISIALLCD